MYKKKKKLDLQIKKTRLKLSHELKHHDNN